MNHFKDFGIKPQAKGMEGDKIKIERILNKTIHVHRFTIEKSKYNDGDCLYLQISVDGAKRVIFTSSGNLIDMIEQVPDDKFPFETTIIKENERFEFT